MSGHDHEMVMRSPREVMGHGGHADMSMEAMVQDMRNRFLVAAVLSVPILLWSAIGRQVLHFGVPAPLGMRDAGDRVLRLDLLRRSRARPQSADP